MIDSACIQYWQLNGEMEFDLAVSYLIGECASRLGCENDVPSSSINSTSQEFGTSFTSAGPGEFVGDILDHPDLLWTGFDCFWVIMMNN